jgi:DNA-binding response OmpR family regulator
MTQPRVLVVDDTPANIRLLEAVLGPHGYAVEGASSGEEALQRLGAARPDLVLLDIVMPGLDGYEVCRRIRATAELEHLPVVMITASSGEEKVSALEAGADDFVMKPFDQAELLARVRSLVRIKQYHDTIQRQAAELAEWNRELEGRVAEQVTQLERLARLKRFLSPQLAELVVTSGDESFLESHRREVTVAFCDLRGFTAFAGTVEPEETMNVLHDYHTALGDLVFRFEGTLAEVMGDGVMVLFNDPIPCPDGPLRSVRMAVAMRSRIGELAEAWRRSGHDLGFSVGLAQGYATLGQIGIADRVEYTAIGTVTNLAQRLCAVAVDGQILVSQRVHAAVEEVVVSTPVNDLELKGFARPLTAHSIVGLNEARVRA